MIVKTSIMIYRFTCNMSSALFPLISHCNSQMSAPEVYQSIFCITRWNNSKKSKYGDASRIIQKIPKAELKINEVCKNRSKKNKNIIKAALKQLKNENYILYTKIRDDLTSRGLLEVGQ